MLVENIFQTIIYIYQTIMNSEVHSMRRQNEGRLNYLHIYIYIYIYQTVFGRIAFQSD
jgi:hypothetical protein